MEAVAVILVLAPDPDPHPTLCHAHALDPENPGTCPSENCMIFLAFLTCLV